MTDNDTCCKGIIHVHSRYSHDGHDSVQEISSRLKEKGVDFCVITDHFEDFDEEKFGQYIADIEATNALRQTILVPAMEAEFCGFHVIFMPVPGYRELRGVIDAGTLSGTEVFKILAHPTKHAVSDAALFLGRHHVDGMEVWNQQADGNYLPPVQFLRRLLKAMPAAMPSVFFGTDIHNLMHRVNNLLLIPRDGELSPQLVMERLRQGDFICWNQNTPHLLRGNCSLEEINMWLDKVERRKNLKGMVRQLVKKPLKFLYHLLPSSTKVAINDFKNSVKSQL